MVHSLSLSVVGGEGTAETQIRQRKWVVEVVHITLNQPGSRCKTGDGQRPCCEALLAARVPQIL